MNNLHIKLDIQRFASSLSIASSVTSQSIQNNTSIVNITVTIKRTSGTTYWIHPNYRYLTIICDGQSYGVNTELPSNKTSVTYSHEFTVTHNNDGTKYIEYSASLPKTSSFPALSTSGNATLPTIPRNFSSSPTLTVQSKTETSVTLKWTTPENCDQVQYKIGSGGSWINVSGTGTSGTYTITGLSANSPYTIYGDWKRADSQLWSTHGGYTVSVSPATYDYPKATNVPDISLRANTTMTIGFDNPLSKTFSYQIISNVDSSVIYTSSDVNITTATINMNDVLTLFYETIPNAKEGTYYVKTTYSGIVRNSENKKYSIDADTCKPIMSVVDYEDINATTLALTNDNQKLVVGYSTIQVIIEDGNKATPQYNATIVGYKIKNGEYLSPIVPEDEGEDIILTCPATSGIIEVYAIDSREQTGIYQIVNTTMVDYIPIAKNQSPIAQRCDSHGDPNGVGEYVKITLGGTFWNNSFGLITNSIKSITYQYANSKTPTTFIDGTTTITETTSQNNYNVSQLILGDTPEGFDISNSYIINVTVEDELSSTTFSMTLASGTPDLSWAENGLGIKKKYDDNNSATLQVGGEVDSTGYNINGVPLEMPTINNSYSNADDEVYSCDYVNKITSKKFIKVRANQNQQLTTAGTMTVLFQNVDTNIGNAFQLVNNRVQIIDPTITMVKVTLTMWLELGNNSYGWCHIGTQNASWNNWKEYSTYMQPPTTQIWHTTTQVALCPIDATNNFISATVYFNNASNDNMVRGGTYSNSVYMIVEAID